MSDDVKPEATEHPAEEAAEPVADAPAEAAPRAALDEGDAGKGAAPRVEAPVVAPPPKPDYVFLGVVSAITLAADLGSKWWATSRLDANNWVDGRVEVIRDHVSLALAHNPGGAFGLLQDQDELPRRAFFDIISVGAIIFIISLYRKLTPGQTALKWGLPLVLGGAAGNLVDRLRLGKVIDFIDVKAGFVGSINSLIGSHTDHWPTFNVADIVIVIGVGLMAVDMFTSRKQKPPGDDAPARTPKPAEPIEAGTGSD